MHRLLKETVTKFEIILLFFPNILSKYPKCLLHQSFALYMLKILTTFHPKSRSFLERMKHWMKLMNGLNIICQVIQILELNIIIRSLDTAIALN